MIDLFATGADDARKAATARLKSEVSHALALTDADTVMVTELACHEPGCPPRETVVAVMRQGRPTETWKFHKAAADLDRGEVRAALNPSGAASLATDRAAHS
jgi:hypothetical protein